MKVAIVGCAHGELDKIYSAVEYMQTRNAVKIDVLLCCGDFQAVRNHGDLQCMAVPPKYRQMNTFFKYYSGELTAPVLTIFIGGNHEASNYLSELPYGGWVAPNIFYLGLAGVVRIGNIRIAGISGIFKYHDYLRGHFERPPYNDSTIRSVYHVRNLEVFRMQQLKDGQPIDVILSHDWPRGIHSHGNESYLFRRKPYFRQEANDNRLGSPPLKDILDKLMPKFWFAAHMHVKYSAYYRSGDDKSTKFLALDKCLPNREYLQVLDIDNAERQSVGEKLCYDREWLAVLKSTCHLTNTSHCTSYMPGPGSQERYDFKPSAEELAEIDRIFENDFTIPSNFVATAVPYFDGGPKFNGVPTCYSNPQTELFCRKLNLSMIVEGVKNYSAVSTTFDAANFLLDPNPDEIALDDEDDEDSEACCSHFPLMTEKEKNPDEIDLDDEYEEGEQCASRVEEEGDKSGNRAKECEPIEGRSLSVKVSVSTEAETEEHSSKEVRTVDAPVFKRRNAAVYCTQADNSD